MQLFKVNTKLIKPGNNLVETILNALDKQKLKIQDGDLLAITSKVVATAERRLKRLNSVEPSKKAKQLAKLYGLDPNFVEIVLQESRLIYGGVSKALLTLKNNVLTANAGVVTRMLRMDTLRFGPKMLIGAPKRSAGRY